MFYCYFVLFINSYLGAMYTILRLWYMTFNVGLYVFDIIRRFMIPCIMHIVPFPTKIYFNVKFKFSYISKYEYFIVGGGGNLIHDRDYHIMAIYYPVCKLRPYWISDFWFPFKNYLDIDGPKLCLSTWYISFTDKPIKHINDLLCFHVIVVKIVSIKLWLNITLIIGCYVLH